MSLCSLDKCSECGLQFPKRCRLSNLRINEINSVDSCVVSTPVFGEISIVFDGGEGKRY